MANNTTKQAKYNPTITALFEDSRFGEGALKSAQINAEAFQAIQRHIQVGSSLLLRRSSKLNKNGNATYFLEVLPPMEAGTRTTKGTGRATSANDDI